jgi:hypothetical protein
MRITSTGNVEVKTGNLVIGTAGKGIDFSAQTSANSVTGVTTGDEVLDHYEEGTWTPEIVGYSGGTTQTYSQQIGKYTKIGNMVYATFAVYLSAKGNISGSYTILKGMPFNNAIANGGHLIISDFDGFTTATTWVGGELVVFNDWCWLTRGIYGSTSSQHINTSEISNTTSFVGTMVYRV